jgi:hypothetical protein
MLSHEYLEQMENPKKYNCTQVLSKFLVDVSTNLSFQSLDEMCVFVAAAKFMMEVEGEKMVK